MVRDGAGMVRGWCGDGVGWCGDGAGMVWDGAGMVWDGAGMVQPAWPGMSSSIGGLLLDIPAGVNGDDFLALGVWRGRIIHRFNLGSGIGTVVSAPLSEKPGIHVVHFGRSLRIGWLKVDNQRNRTGSSPGPLVDLNTFGWLYVGGFSEQTPELLPPGSRFRSGFQGCIFDLLLRMRRGDRLQPLEGQPIQSRSVGQCGVNPCALVRCQNGGTCFNSTSSAYCQCPSGWKGALCSETMSACDAEHVPPPSCARGSTCMPLLHGYSCQCPLGTTGQYCHQALAISDPSFNGTQSSWMSFPLLGVKYRTDVELQFQTSSPEGLMFYTAQHLGAGDFFSLSLTSGFMQLRYNLGDRTVHLQSANRVDVGGGSWHTARAGRQGNRGHLLLDGVETRLDPPPGTAMLDVASEMFVGGVPTSNNLPADAVEGELTGFTGCIRELMVNGRRLDLSETGALDGANVGDCDGTACGFHVCRNGGHCAAVSPATAICTCPPLWTGPTCSLSVFCLNNLCQHSSTCVPDLTSASYHCSCPLGREGTRCERATSLRSAGFLGDSFLKYRDPEYPNRTLTYTKIAFNFTSSSSDGLVLWMGKAEYEDEDYLAIGLHNGHLKMAVNLGERLSVPLVHRGARLCCGKWHHLAVVHNRTAVQAFIDGERVVFEDVDPLEQYVALDYGGMFYFGGFELYKSTSEVTHGLFSQGFVGKLKDVFLYDDLRALQLLQNSEGINVYEGD
ncbi:protein eyes shut homolog [Brienomyrus brachyistius]|uniref:protein eyes shut homolog n=1 Tax=Brienomyrus brachyistius TaxID=42636 RepID=UPI0020B27C90|nr:protein eyes shut homolog [Brienomyrus brachyistius]